MMNVISKIGSFSVKHLNGTRADGKAYDFYALEKRTFNKEKNEWESKELFLTPAEMSIVSALTYEAAAQISREEALSANQRLSDKQADTAGVPF